MKKGLTQDINSDGVKNCCFSSTNIKWIYFVSWMSPKYN